MSAPEAVVAEPRVCTGSGGEGIDPWELEKASRAKQIALVFSERFSCC